MTTGADPTLRLVARVVGEVQGVGYRWYVQREAIRAGVVGWVANEPDGSVTVVAEGPPTALDALEMALRAGPTGARVGDLTVQRLPSTGGFGRFEIRSGSHTGD